MLGLAAAQRRQRRRVEVGDRLARRLARVLEQDRGQLQRVDRISRHRRLCG